MRDWLDFIFPDYGLIEARFIQGGSVHRTFTSRKDTVEATSRERSEAGWDVYVGVLPRRSYGGTEQDVWPVSTILWCDVDAKDFCTCRDNIAAVPDHKNDALDAVLKFPIPPSCIVDSGHGFHLYWKLHTPANTPEAVEANRAISTWIGGDHCFDAPRILRVPGTTNNKNPDDPLPVRLLKLDTLRTYDLSDFTEVVEALHREERPRYIRAEGERRQDAPDWLKDLINTEPAPGTRSEEEFRAGLWLARLGYTPDEVLDVLLNSPIGAKAQERGERWARAEVERIVRKA